MTPEERAEALIPNPEHIGMMAGQDRLLAEQDRQLAVAITADTIRAAVAEAKAEEREACAKIADDWRTELRWKDYETYYGDGVIDTITGTEIAELIRARK